MMFEDKVSINDQELQSFGIKLESKIQHDNLIVEAYNLDGQLQYVGKIEHHPLIVFQDLIELIKQGKFKTIQKKQHRYLQIRVGVANIVLFCINGSQERLSKLQNEKNDLSTEISSLKYQLVQLEKRHEQANYELKKDFQQKINNILIFIKKEEYERQLMLHMVPKEDIKMKEQNNFDLTPLSLPISQIRWSRKLSLITKINGNIASSLEKLKGYQSVLQVGFSKEIKKKQLWALKIKSQTGLNEGYINAHFGITLMENESEDYKQIGHGHYGITLHGYTMSHSHEEFNNSDKSFEVNFGDVVYMEYDPIEWKLRFQRNQNGLKFEMPIIPPPQGNAYHPYFEYLDNFRAQGKLSTELILPGRLLG